MKLGETVLASDVKQYFFSFLLLMFHLQIIIIVSEEPNMHLSFEFAANNKDKQKWIQVRVPQECLV